jgi:hypothetical protein
MSAHCAPSYVASDHTTHQGYSYHKFTLEPLHFMPHLRFLTATRFSWSPIIIPTGSVALQHIDITVDSLKTLAPFITALLSTPTGHTLRKAVLNMPADPKQLSFMSTVITSLQSFRNLSCPALCDLSIKVGGNPLAVTLLRALLWSAILLALRHLKLAFEIIVMENCDLLFVTFAVANDRHDPKMLKPVFKRHVVGQISTFTVAFVSRHETNLVPLIPSL